MPKKSRRTKKRQPRAAKPQQAAPGVQNTDSPPQAVQNTRPTTQGRPATQESAAQSSGSQRHVITELKQIGILAGGILLTLVVLSFVLG